jgi:ClpP class serine protease
MRVLEYLRAPSRIWAIEEGAWEEMVSIASGHNLSVEAIEASIGKMNNKTTNSYDVIDGVAVIPVIGPIVKYGNLFSSISGATSVTKLTNDFSTALTDDSVKSILFEIDSPGGEANGINEFAEQIFNARGTKPIQAYISGQGCSAAYWIASAVDEGKVFLDETAMVGSIGVAAVVKNEDEKDAKEGIKTYKFVSEGSENKRPDLDTDEGKSVVMESLNYMAQVFRAKVARNRSNDNSSLTVRDVIEKFNRGGTLMGEAAVKAGLADSISSYKEVLSNLINEGGEEQDALLENLQENFMNTENENGVTTASAAENDAAIRALESKITELTDERQALADQLTEMVDNIAVTQISLEAEIAAKATLQEENLTLKAEAKAKELSSKMVPAQVESFVKSYVIAAKDDQANPIEGVSRLDNFLSMWTVSESHNLEEEELDPDNAELAASFETKGEDFAELVASVKEYATKQNARANV